jgi:hypothetical protein
VLEQLGDQVVRQRHQPHVPAFAHDAQGVADEVRLDVLATHPRYLTAAQAQPASEFEHEA